MYSTSSKEILLRNYEKRSALSLADREPWPMPAFRQPGITAPMTMTANPSSIQASGDFTGAQNYVLETQKVTRVITFQIELDCDIIHSLQNLYHTFSGVGDLAMVDIINTVKCQKAIGGWFDKRCASKAIEMIAQLNYSFTPESVHFDCIRGHGFLSVLAALDDHYSTIYVLPLSADTAAHVIHKLLDECGSVEKVTFVANFPKMRVCKFFDIRSAMKLLQKNNSPDFVLLSSTNIVDLLNNYTWDRYLALALSFRQNGKTKSTKKPEVFLKKKWNTLANWIPTIYTGYDEALSEKARKAVLEDEPPNLVTTAAPASAGLESNAIDLSKIFQGEDTRSTVMIQNIPNKYDRDQFKAFLDVSNKNTYDFLCELILQATFEACLILTLQTYEWILPTSASKLNTMIPEETAILTLSSVWDMRLSIS